MKVVKMVSRTLLMVTVVLGLMACANNKRNGQQHAGMGSEAGGVGDTVQFYGSNMSPEAEKELLAQNTYYFDYDKFDISEKDMMSLYAHAKRLVSSPEARIRLEGHTDERGSREYNVALGERRGNAIANILMLKGVPQNQINIVSYGKEKPETAGQGESAWSKNRRGVIVYERE